MRIAFIAFDGMTALDLVGAFDPLTRLGTMGFVSDCNWTVCATTPEVRDKAGLRLAADAVRPSLDAFDLVVVPGGPETRALVHDAAYVQWIATSRGAKLRASVCTGALLLGAAGLLKGRRATTHPSAFEQLAPYCAEVVRDARVVDEGDLVTARGVTAAIDLGLHLCARIAGRDAAEKIRERMDYPHGARIAQE